MFRLKPLRIDTLGEHVKYPALKDESCRWHPTSPCPGTWRRWIEPWYLAYALLGAAVGGVVPMAVPLTVHRTGSLAAIGLVMAAYGTGLAVYAPAGRWSERYGPARVVHAALGVRFLAFGVLWSVSLTSWGHHRWLALLGYLAVVLAWSALSVGGTGWTARLAWRREGEGLGLFNATTALAGVLGAGLGGWLAASWGLHAVWGLVIMGVGLGLLLTLALCPRPQAH